MTFIYGANDNSILTDIEGNPESLVIPSNVVTIKRGIFSSKSTKYISFDDESLLETLESSCFESASSIISVDFSKCLKLTSLSKWCFYKCSKLEKCVLPKYAKFTILSIGSFSFCSSLKSFSFPSTCRVFDDCNGEFTAVFDMCTGLENVYFPVDSCLENIGIYGFINCRALTEIRLPKTIRRIGSYAFYSCVNLKKLLILSDATLGIELFLAITGNIETVFYLYPTTRNQLLSNGLNSSQIKRIMLYLNSCNIQHKNRIPYSIFYYMLFIET
jgi:hypothetical protein